MDKEKIKELKDKKVYVELTSGRKYSGIINDIDDFVYLTDKFGERVIFAISEIKFLEVNG